MLVIQAYGKNDMGKELIEVRPMTDLTPTEIDEMADDFHKPENVVGACGYIKGDEDMAPKVEGALRELARIMRGGKVAPRLFDVSQIPTVALVDKQGHELMRGFYFKMKKHYKVIGKQEGDTEYVVYCEPGDLGGANKPQVREVNRDAGEKVVIEGAKKGLGSDFTVKRDILYSSKVEEVNF